MWDILILIGLIAVWVFVSRFIFPKIGVPV
jgi:hypothetical protein